MRHLLALTLLLPTLAAAGDHFVFLGAHKTLSAAQEMAGMGWVLDTDIYDGLTPGLYTVVLGPYATQAQADAALAQVRRLAPDAYVKDAGQNRLAALVPEGMAPAALAAFLGDLVLQSARQPGGQNPCEPQQPYDAVQVLQRTTVRDGSGAFVTRLQPVGPASLTVDARTGSVQRMSLCAE